MPSKARSCILSGVVGSSSSFAGVTKVLKSLNNPDLPSGRREDTWPVTISHNQPSADEIGTSLNSASPSGRVSIGKTYDLVVFPPLTVSSFLIWTGLQMPESGFGVGMAVQNRHRGCGKVEASCKMANYKRSKVEASCMCKQPQQCTYA